MPIIDKDGNLRAGDNIEIINNAAQVGEIMAQFAGLDALGIAFPSHHDGRGYSLAKKLRRAGFTGKLRAIGPLIPDQFADLIACGFDEIEITEEHLLRQPIAQWQTAKALAKPSYQNGNAGKTSIFLSRKQKLAGELS